MATKVLMPKLSDTMEDGKILRWLKNPGDAVSIGEVLAEVETDKADMEIEAESAGVLSEIVIAAGGSAGVGDVIASLRDGQGPSEPLVSPEGGEKAEELPVEKDPELIRPSAEGPDRQVAAAPSDGEEVSWTPNPDLHSARASAEALQLAGKHGIDVSKISGSGPGGWVVTRDLQLGAVEPDEEVSLPARNAAAAPRREELSRIRRTVARRMAESKREVPHFYLTTEVEMENCMRLKDGLRAARPDSSVSYTHILVCAVTLALLEHPRINARYVPDDVVEFSEGVHIGVAVSLDEGLIVPVLHDCDRKDLFTIAAETKELVGRVRTGKPHGDDLSGGTFTISNLGMFPIEEFAAVINPPQAAVLAVGALGERPIVRDGNLAVANTMRVTLSSDHRVIDGAEAAQFLETLKRILENPVPLLI